MKNQVDILRGYYQNESVAHVLNSSLNKTQINQVKEDITSKKTKLLYVAPESLVKEENIEFLNSVKISFYAIDEAHCISEWGHDFRPEYRKLKQIINTIGVAPILALTATATPKVRQDIMKNLEINDGKLYIDSFNRSNLFYEICTKTDVAKQIMQYINSRKEESGIIYCLSRKKVEEIAKIVEQNGIEAWFSLDIEELLGEDSKNYKKLTDTLDVWFDSGTTHATVLKLYESLEFPADLYLEGSDQHRGWFQSSLLTSCAINNGHPPYKALLTHGFVVDGDGRKMSKSRGNVIAPQKVINTLGADILRLWAASTDYSGEISISDEILKRVVESYRRVRNTLRFLLANLSDFNPETDFIEEKNWLEIDRYMLTFTRSFQDDLIQSYRNNEFHVVVNKLHYFCSEDLGGFYLDILKDRLYTATSGGVARRSAQSALFHIAHSLVRLLSPILSFTAEEAWEHLTNKHRDSIFLHTWYKFPLQTDTKLIVQRWNRLRELRSEVQKRLEESRKQGVIGSSLSAVVEIHSNGDDFLLLHSLGDDLRLVFVASEVNLIQVQSTSERNILVTPSKNPKCERCWHYRKDVGYMEDYPTICSRCVSNLFGPGEERKFA